MPTPTPAPAAQPCFGDLCGDAWKTCEAAGNCAPVDKDCGIPGVCVDLAPPGEAPVIAKVTDYDAWVASKDGDINAAMQDKVVDVPEPPSGQPMFCGKAMFDERNITRRCVFPRRPYATTEWFNPLGLLARRLIDHIDRWRGSVAPRPLIRTADLELIDRVSNVRAAGLPTGVHVMLTDQGGSTGKTLTMQILNLSGEPVLLSLNSFAVQPIKQQAQQKVMQAFGRLSKEMPERLDLSAYCVEFLKLPPGPNTLLRLAPANVQQKYASMTKVLQSAYRVSKADLLHPDSNPAAYTDSIKQWSLWAVEQNFNQQSFTEAFIGHTRKNVESAGQKWSKDAEAVIRKVSPNRWQDITRILRGAGLRVPQ
jgi:hypothetical protein